MKKGTKILLAILSVLCLLAVGFIVGVVFNNSNKDDDVTVASTETTSEEMPTEELTTEELTQEFSPTQYEALGTELPSEYMELDELLAHFEKNDYPVTWPVLWVVVTEIDADGIQSDDTITHINVQMPQEEQDFYLNEMAESFESTVEEFTGGLVDIELTVVLYDEPVNYLDGYENCLSPQSFNEEMQESFLDYNSVICTARFCEPYAPIVPQDWLGLAFIMGDIQYGFCQVASNYEYDCSTFKTYDTNPYQAEPWIHEWIHTLEPFCEQLGDPIPNPDSADFYKYECMNPGAINGFYDYYYDTLMANVWDASQDRHIGITPAMWRTMAYYYDQMR